jgi:hypothetical protein
MFRREVIILCVQDISITGYDARSRAQEAGGRTSMAGRDFEIDL